MVTDTTTINRTVRHATMVISFPFPCSIVGVVEVVLPNGFLTLCIYIIIFILIHIYTIGISIFNFPVLQVT